MWRHPLTNSELPNNPANNEVQQRRPKQAPEPGVERRGQSAIRHQPPIRRRQPCGHPTHRPGQAAKHHRRARVIQPHPACGHRCADHHQNGLDQPGGNRQRHHIGTGANRRTSDRPDDVRHRARTDGGHAHRIAITERPGNARPDNERQNRAQQQRDHADHPGLLRFGGLHFEGRGDDGKVAQHRAAHQTDPREQCQVRQACLLYTSPSPRDS